MAALYAHVMESLVGAITIIADDKQVREIVYGDHAAPDASGNAVTAEAARELSEYFTKKRVVFSVPFEANGTPFQQAVWRALCDIPYGETRSYKDIAAAIGNPNACRAVGLANGKNPIPILIPCHRVIGKNGSLTGYGSGLHIKQALLLLEGTAEL